MFFLKPKNNQALSAQNMSDAAAKMPFGKHKGCNVADVPRSYLEWFLREINGCGEVKDVIRALLAIPKPKPAREGVHVEYMAPGLRSVSGDLTQPIPRWRDGWDEPDSDQEPPFDVPHKLDAKSIDAEFREMFS